MIYKEHFNRFTQVFAPYYLQTLTDMQVNDRCHFCFLNAGTFCKMSCCGTSYHVQ